jgi:hypothetical protein
MQAIPGDEVNELMGGSDAFTTPSAGYGTDMPNTQEENEYIVYEQFSEFPEVDDTVKQQLLNEVENVTSALSRIYETNVDFYFSKSEQNFRLTHSYTATGGVNYGFNQNTGKLRSSGKYVVDFGNDWIYLKVSIKLDDELRKYIYSIMHGSSSRPGILVMSNTGKYITLTRNIGSSEIRGISPEPGYNFKLAIAAECQNIVSQFMVGKYDIEVSEDRIDKIEDIDARKATRRNTLASKTAEASGRKKVYTSQVKSGQKLTKATAIKRAKSYIRSYRDSRISFDKFYTKMRTWQFSDAEIASMINGSHKDIYIDSIFLKHKSRNMYKTFARRFGLVMY